MTETAARRIAAAAAGAPSSVKGGRAHARLLARLLAHFAVALHRENDERRLVLWLPVAAGAGSALYFAADREPSLAFSVIAFLIAAALAYFARQRRAVFAPLIACAAVLAGFSCACLRTASVAAPMLDRIRIVNLTGYIEEMDLRPQGARFLLRVASAEGLAPRLTPYRVRLTARRAPAFQAGDFVAVKARLLPPSQAEFPGGYDFARTAFFARIGAVGSVLGAVRAAKASEPAPLALRFFAQIDHARNALARRIASVLHGPSAAVAVAMVTGKRDYLGNATKDVIRQAGIFHIITISGVQMTLVAGILFWGTRRLLALSRTLALDYPIKTWAALIAMTGAVGYDLATGSRIGTQRALIMTLILLGAVVCGRRAFSMRNLALAAAAVVIFEPESIMGASFQLSFAAVAALVAVQEARNIGAIERGGDETFIDRRDPLLLVMDKVRAGPGRLLFATACATAATASFMAYDFHELSPYVLIGNPLTLAVIEAFAVPGALLGALLYPLGLDAFVWRYIGAGIDLVLWAAKRLAAAPGSTLHLVAFAPWALGFLALAVLSIVIWRSVPMRLTALPFALIGLLGASAGDRFAVDAAPGGDAVAVRTASGRLAVMGRRPSLFAVEQWLSADGDGRPARQALIPRSGSPDGTMRCDRLGCVALTPDATVSVVLDPRAFPEDCARADIIVSPLFAPARCGARLVLDRAKLAKTGAVALRFRGERIEVTRERSRNEDRPWSPAPRALPTFALRVTPSDKPRPEISDSSDLDP